MVEGPMELIEIDFLMEKFLPRHLCLGVNVGPVQAL